MVIVIVRKPLTDNDLNYFSIPITDPRLIPSSRAICDLFHPFLKRLIPGVSAHILQRIEIQWPMPRFKFIES